jgi:hypothetical protein
LTGTISPLLSRFGVLIGHRQESDNIMNHSKLYLGALITVLMFTAASVMAGLPSAPDAGSTSLLLGMAAVGLVTVKRFLRR